jgi:hypothetical protein
MKYLFRCKLKQNRTKIEQSLKDKKSGREEIITFSLDNMSFKYFEVQEQCTIFL